jgi:hypothetical protein
MTWRQFCSIAILVLGVIIVILNEYIKGHLIANNYLIQPGKDKPYTTDPNLVVDTQPTIESFETGGTPPPADPSPSPHTVIDDYLQQTAPSATPAPSADSVYPIRNTTFDNPFSNRHPIDTYRPINSENISHSKLTGLSYATPVYYVNDLGEGFCNMNVMG